MIFVCQGKCKTFVWFILKENGWICCVLRHIFYNSVKNIQTPAFFTPIFLGQVKNFTICLKGVAAQVRRLGDSVNRFRKKKTSWSLVLRRFYGAIPICVSRHLYLL
jgi:hypothetical protein